MLVRGREVAALDQDVAEVVLRASQRQPVVQRFVDGQRALGVVSGLAQLPDLAVGEAQAAVHQRGAAQDLDHLPCGNRRFLASLYSLPTRVRRLERTQD